MDHGCCQRFTLDDEQAVDIKRALQGIPHGVKIDQLTINIINGTAVHDGSVMSLTVDTGRHKNE